MNPTEYTPDNITQLANNEVFIFGSNESGFHGAGAAKVALNKFGAVWGTGDGPQGQSYGISTKDRKLRVLSLDKIQIKVARFLRYAAQHPDKKFLVTKIGTGLAGYSPRDIAPLFGSTIPSNVILPIEFWSVILNIPVDKLRQRDGR